VNASAKFAVRSFSVPEIIVTGGVVNANPGEG